MRIRTTLCALAALGAAGGLAATGAPADSGDARTYVVLLDPAASTDAGRAAIERAGGTVERYNSEVGVATARSTRDDFAAQATAERAIQAASTQRAIGRVPAESRQKQDRVALERLQDERRKGGQPGEHPPTPSAEPLDPDIAPNFNKELSRNFTVDDPVIDGPCASDPDGSCADPNDVDEDGHGTHVAGTIASPLNGQGIGGVAPRSEIVNLRAGQDSGYFFVQPAVDAITYAADHGIDVVNMSFYIDPWLYNCAANPADSEEAQAQQRTIIAATQRAVDYARSRGVTLVAAAGNEHTDLGNPTFDDTSPDYPPDAAYDRTVDNSCLDVPTETDGVIPVSSVGPSGRKAYYSNYGTEQVEVAAPGGDYRDFPGTDRFQSPKNLILAPYPKSVGLASGDIDPKTGEPTNAFVVKDGDAYYQYLQGTSMAAPHAAGVAALIVSEYGKADRRNGGLTLAADKTAKILHKTATDTACPNPREFVYPGRPAAETAYCEGSP
ncbi:MAG: S8 family serine peptidase, partial [Solirubrobacterales bacterium]|nr:S8 family serine peptidase [Solirubrobacterales bacterium]